MTAWDESRFSRRTYTVEGDDLDRAQKIELIVKVDGKAVVQVQAREPGMLAFVSKPEDQGFDIEIVEPGGKRYMDIRLPSEADGQGLLDWQRIALGL